jgi:RNA methyltransferase, TrmH family
VLALGETANPGGWKALRAAMGSTFRLPVAVGEVGAAIDASTRAGWRIAATVARAGASLDATPFTTPTLLLLGREGSGLSADLVARATDRLTIDMRAGVDSLNVATTAAVCLYEAHRQLMAQKKAFA